MNTSILIRYKYDSNGSLVRIAFKVLEGNPALYPPKWAMYAVSQYAKRFSRYSRTGIYEVQRLSTRKARVRPIRTV